MLLQMLSLQINMAYVPLLFSLLFSRNCLYSTPHFKCLFKILKSSLISCVLFSCLVSLRNQTTPATFFFQKYIIFNPLSATCNFAPSVSNLGLRDLKFFYRSGLCKNLNKFSYIYESFNNSF